MRLMRSRQRKLLGLLFGHRQILSEETGVGNTIDPLAGSYFVEALTRQIEELAWEYIRKSTEMGGWWLRLSEVIPGGDC